MDLRRVMSSTIWKDENSKSDEKCFSMIVDDRSSLIPKDQVGLELNETNLRMLKALERDLRDLRKKDKLQISKTIIKGNICNSISH